MDSISWAQWATYVSYLFVIVAYTVKVIKYFRMPMHLRWELYPVPHEKGNRYGGSYMEEMEWWTKPRSKNVLRNILDIFKRYLSFSEYFRKVRGYWAGLYPWHIGFYLIVLFDGFTMLGGILLVTTGMAISSTAGGFGVVLYYLTMIVGIVSFITGIIGSIILLIKRLTDSDLKEYAAPINYFNYIFFLLVFASGLVSLPFDPTLSGYREFWAGIFSYKFAAVDPATFTHIMLFSLFLIYLPFTRSTHYITKILAFFSVRWDDKPNLRGSKIEKKVEELLGQPVTWSAAHIQAGKTWGETAKGMPEDISGKK